MTTLPKVIYKFNVILIRLSMAFSTELEPKNFTMCMEKQKILESQNNLEKEKQSRCNQAPWLQVIPQSYSHQNSMTLAQRQTQWSMEQNRKPGNKPMHLSSIHLRQRKQECMMGERQFLQYVVLGKLNSYKKKNEIEYILKTYTKINSKWIKELNLRPGSIKLLEENTGRTLWHKSEQDLFQSTS